MTTLASDTLTKQEIKPRLAEIFARFSGSSDELIPLPQETQAEFRYLPAAAMKEIASFLKIPEATIFGVSTFYSQFKLTPLGRKIVRVCRGTCLDVCPARFDAVVKVSGEEIDVPAEPAPVTAGKPEKAAAAN